MISRPDRAGHSRRELLQYAAIALAGSPFFGLLACSAPASRRLARALASAYPRPGGLHAARRIGERYLAQAAPDRRADLVEALLGPVVELLESARGPDAAVTLLRDAVRADFAAGRTVLFDGWTLAKTEVTLCALLSVEV